MDKYPKFISNKPLGIDKFKGGSQERLSKAIANHFINHDQSLNTPLPRIIGLEGTWGSGKSNVVKLVELELKDKGYYFFEYDAWGNQEDLQRRSLLEQLTAKLIQYEILVDKTAMKIKGGKAQDVNWNEKLKFLLARKMETISEKIPKLGIGVVLSFLTLLLTTLFTAIANAIPQGEKGSCSLFIIKSLLSLAPIIVTLIIWAIYAIKNKRYRSIDFLFAIYQNKIESDICYETISEDEPTVHEFKSWMEDVSKGLNDKKCKKLVIVFDNMDRLPREKVKQLWSSIHTFFSDNSFDNIWTIIPFDEKHLSCAFGDKENDDKTKELTKYFINKTFPVVYRVSPPVITDYQNIFETLFCEAFGDTISSNEASLISRIYRIEKTNANVREIIVFINTLVALKQTWNNEINIVSMAIFSLYKDKILEKETITRILSGDYLEKIKNFIDDKKQLEAEISALAYGINVEYAKQIPLTKYLEKCLSNTKGYEINIYSENNNQFDNILRKVCDEIDLSQIDLEITNLNKLKKNNGNIENIWEDLSKRRMKIEIENQCIPDEFKILLLHVCKNSKKKIINYLCNHLRKANDFKGSTYFNCMKDLTDYLNEKEIKLELPLNDMKVSASVFVEYVTNAKNDYSKYKLSTDMNELDEYLVSLLPDKYTFKEISILENYQFPKLLNAIQELFKSKKINSENWSDVISTYKYLIGSKQKLPEMLNSSEINNIRNEMSNNVELNELDEYTDILVASISIGQGNVEITPDNINYISNTIEYYENLTKLMLASFNRNNTYLNKVLKFMIEENIGIHLDLKEILPHYNDIKKTINISDDLLINYLDRKKIDNDCIKTDNIKTIIKQDFYDIKNKPQNDLTNTINKIAIQSLNKISGDELYANRKNSYYWNNVIKSLIATKFMEKAPDCVNKLASRIYIDYIKNNTTLSDYDQKVISNIDNNEIGHIFIKIRDEFCNNHANISKEKFLFIEENLREHGDLKNRDSEVINYIIKPIISFENCYKIILNQSDFYINLINNAKEVNDFKRVVNRLLENSSNLKLISFAKSIGIEKEKK